MLVTMTDVIQVCGNFRRGRVFVILVRMRSLLGRDPHAGQVVAGAPTQEFSIERKLLRRNVKWLRGGLVFKVYRPVYHSTLGLEGTYKKNRRQHLARL